jgi:hypothetical protein
MNYEINNMKKALKRWCLKFIEEFWCWLRKAEGKLNKFNVIGNIYHWLLKKCPIHELNLLPADVLRTFQHPYDLPVSKRRYKHCYLSILCQIKETSKGRQFECSRIFLLLLHEIVTGNRSVHAYKLHFSILISNVFGLFTGYVLQDFVVCTMEKRTIDG